MRPRTLAEFVGQRQFLGEGKLLNRLLKADRLGSVIFYGPPGTGKTSLAQIIARQTRSKFERLSGVDSNVADIRRVIATATNRPAFVGAFMTTSHYAGDVRVTHMTDEHVPVDELRQAAEALILTALRFCGVRE